MKAEGYFLKTDMRTQSILDSAMFLREVQTAEYFF